MELRITEGLASLLDQTATAVPEGSAATCGSSSISPPAEMSTAPVHAPPGALAEAWTTVLKPPPERSQTESASPVGPRATCGAAESWAAVERSTAPDHAPPTGLAAACTTWPLTGPRDQTATTSPDALVAI